jgi:DNA-binding transcriptional LysR family regulator
VQRLKLERPGKQRQSLELDLSGRVSVDDYAALADLVARGLGVGLLPALHVRHGVANARLVRLFPPWFARSANVYLVSAGRRQPERVRVLAEFLREAFAELRPV